MRFTHFRAAAAALLPLAASCASSSYPASPVPAVLSDTQAAEIADEYLDTRPDRDMRAYHVRSMLPMQRGYLITFVSEFDEGAKPPKASRMVLVHNDGTARELVFRHGE